MNDLDRAHPENLVINDPDAGEFCPATKHETRRIHLHELPLITITCINKKTGGMWHERYTLDQLPDTESGLQMYTMTKEGGGRATIMMGQYPSCSCESHSRNRAIYCKHLVCLMKIQEIQAVKPQPKPQEHDYSRAESEDWQ